jgi:hypothetical protein
VLRQGRFATSCAGPNLGEGTNLRVIVLVRRAEPRAGHYKDGTWCDLRKRQMESDEAFAAMTYPVSAWLAVGLLAMSLPLPWMAVLMANDAPARVTEDTHRLTGGAPVRQLETRSHMIVDIPENR